MWLLTKANLSGVVARASTCADFKSDIDGAPPATPPGALPALTAPALHLSSTILHDASRSASEEVDTKNFSNYLWLFSTRMPTASSSP
jgi:hypothetical protein